ncbi:Gfo/Idh/MocA family protein [Paenibacillus nasutitermitis]|uniref:Inositol 2-dehydrogenase n=1 Tax=Paenibacillus nasutitermitis TaxID=1652958 RepID=A0A916Z959_9BACL|nr:Gfo/Idh/MocA family oxidoreductase [Paenibacillus nasutitermitis]GGD82659.1 inositol 2-dehydrogenase [Paenibacillus nasutitermitis]
MSIRFGMIGAGGIAQYHVKALTRIQNVRIASVFDINPEQASKVANETGATIATSAEQLLDNKEIDAVLICSPQFARGQLEEIAASRNLHLLVEKPLGLSMEDVIRKGRAIRESGVINSIGYCLRYLDTVQMAKQYLQGKQVHLVQVHRYGTRHSAKWWNQLAMSGGFLVDAVTHQVDLVRYLVSEFNDVYANFGRHVIQQESPDSTIYDGGALSFTLLNGAVGTLTESCVSPYYNGSEIKIFGPDYYLSLSANGMQITIIDENQNVTKTSKMNAYYEQDKRFVEAVVSGTSQHVLCNYEDASKTLAVTLAANQSFIERKSMSLV